MSRGTTLRIPSVSGPIKGGDAVDFNRVIGKEPNDVDVVFAAASTAASRHGMGKRYVGGHVICANIGHSDALVVASPSAAEALGYDPAVYVVVLANASYSGTVTVRVF